MSPARDWQYRWPLLRRVLSPLTVALIFGLLVGVGSAGLQIHDTLSRVREGLPAEILRQSGDVARLVQSLGEVLRAVELAELDPDSERQRRALERNQLLLARLEAIRKGYVFDNQVGAAAVHAVINPAAEDIGRWLTEGLPGLAADSPMVLELVRVRAVQAYDRARTLANEAGETALGLMEQESARLEQFRISMMIFLAVLVLLTLGLVGVLVARRLAEVRLETLRRQLADAIESIPEGFVLCDAQDRVVMCNDRYRHMYRGIDALARPGADFESVVRAFLEHNPLIGSQSDLEEVLAARMAAHRRPQGPFEHELVDGRRIRITERRTRDGGYVGIHADITDVRRVQERLHHLAHHDPLTGLPNRGYGQERLEQGLARARRRGDSFAVLYLDLDRFKLVNDTLGHHVGDELLRAVARRLRSNLREEDTLARLGGDEFMILLEADEATALISAQRLVSALAQPFQVAGHEVLVTTSMGIALYPRDGAEGDTLMQNADAASYWAKAQGPNNYRVYTLDLNAEARSRVELENALRQAIAQGGLVIHYQPRFDLVANRLTGVEALLRWRHPQRGLLEPDDFLELAEDSGLILPMGEWVLEEACRQYRHWQVLGLAPPALAINLSARQLRQPGFADELDRLLGRIGLEPPCLELELTEDFLLEDPQLALEVLGRLHALGVRLTLDDFGRGYSSLGLLSRLPLSVLKIDQAFLQDLEDQAVLPTVEAILALGRALGLEVVAEGVETAGQREWLRRRGCQEVQGFLLGRPLPSEELEQVLKSRQNQEGSAGTIPEQGIGT